MADYPDSVSLPVPGNDDSMAEGSTYAGPVVIGALADEIVAIATDLTGTTNAPAKGAFDSVAERIADAESRIDAVEGGAFTTPVTVTTSDTGASLTVTATASSTSAAAVDISSSTTSGATTTSALSVESIHPNVPTVQISGQETGAATLKVVHSGTSDSAASAVSINLKTAGTSASGLDISTPDGTTGGNLLRINSNSRDELVVKGTGRVGIGVSTGAAPAGVVEIKQTAAGTVGLVVTGIGGNTADLVQIATSTANRVVINKDGNTTFSGTVTTSSTATLNGATTLAGTNTVSGATNFTGAAQIGPTSTAAGGVRVLGIGDATTIPSTTPSSGGVLYSESGALKWRDSNGNPTQLAPSTAITNGARANTYISNSIGGSTPSANALTNDTVHFVPVFIPNNPAAATHQVGSVSIYVSTAYSAGTQANNKVFGAIYKADAYGFPTGDPIVSESTGSSLYTTAGGAGSAGLVTMTLATTAVSPGKHWVALRVPSTATVSTGQCQGGTGVQPGVPIISPPSSGTNVMGLKISGGNGSAFPTVDGSTTYLNINNAPTVWLKLGAA